MQVFLLILSLVAPAIGAPTEEWADGISDGFAGPGYIVPNNISIDPFVEIDPTIPGIRLALDLEAADAGLGPDVEPQGGGLEARAAVTTSFILGKTRAEYGCDQSIRAVFESAITTLCYQGGCDDGSSYYRSVRWSKGDRQRVNIRVAVTGTYSGNVRHRLVDAVKQTVNPQSATSYEKRWAVQIGLGGQAVLKCTMSRFPNYVQVTRRVNGNLRDEIKVTVYPPEKEKQIGAFRHPFPTLSRPSTANGQRVADHDVKPTHHTGCIIASTLAAIAGAIGGVAGGFFGTVAVPFCS